MSKKKEEIKILLTLGNNIFRDNERYILKLLENNGGSMKISEMVNKKSKEYNRLGITNKILYRQIGSTIYDLYRRGIVSVDNIEPLYNDTEEVRNVYVRLIT